MIKRSIYLLLLTLTSCNQQNDGAPANQQKEVAPVASQAVDPAPASPTLEFGASEAEAAKAFVSRYLTLIEKKRYPEALSLWTEYGQKSFQGKPSLLATQYDRFSSFRAKPSPGSSIDSNPSHDRVLVPVTADVVLRSDGSKRSLRGVVHLHRRNATDWQVDGVDIRRSAGD